MTTLADTNVCHRYRPLLELGHGRISQTYLAESLGAGVQKLVVLKLLDPVLRDDPHARTVFQHEAAFSAHLNHPNTAYVFEVAEYEGAPLIVMEYLEGVPFKRMLSHAGPRLSLPIRLHILTQVLAGLHHCHELKDVEGNPLNAVHRDVSPHNIIVLHEGGVKVVGFGIAKATMTADAHTPAGMMNGNVHYMSPEQLFGEVELDRRADVYTVGVMLWEAIARRPMWKGVDRSGVVEALSRGALPSLRELAPDLPSELEEVVMRALSLDRETRYASAQALQIALVDAARETVGIAKLRELVDFMAECFGTERQRRRQAIARARGESYPLLLPSESSVSVALTSGKAGRWLRAPRATGIVLAAVLMTGGAIWASGETTRSERGAARPSARAPQARSERAKTVSVAARDDAGPVLLGANGNEPLDEGESVPRPALDVITRPPARRASRPRRAEQPAARAGTPIDVCDPPYRLTEDGVKEFKPECF